MDKFEKIRLIFDKVGNCLTQYRIYLENKTQKNLDLFLISKNGLYDLLEDIL